MFYSVLKFFIRRALNIFCTRIIVKSDFQIPVNGPILLASNHPNSFLDAVIIGTRFDNTVYFLARGDIFRNPFVRRILNRLKMIPVYRLSEGREYLALNDATFDQCIDIFAHNGIILIFSEGLCAHQVKLRPLKKGTARIALNAMKQPGFRELFKVIPVSISYDSFTRFGKLVIIRFGQPIVNAELDEGSDTTKIYLFNKLLSERLTDSLNRNMIPVFYSHREKVMMKWGIVLLWPLAVMGFVIHLPLYKPLQKFAESKTRKTVFYDSVLFGSLLLIYPIYWVVINVSGFLLVNSVAVRLILFLAPLWAWFYARWKYCLVNEFY